MYTECYLKPVMYVSFFEFDGTPYKKVIGTLTAQCNTPHDTNKFEAPALLWCEAFVSEVVARSIDSWSSALILISLKTDESEHWA